MTKYDNARSALRNLILAMLCLEIEHRMYHHSNTLSQFAEYYRQD